MGESNKNGERNRLTREAILHAALRYVDEHGVEKLGMRQLATELGVNPMAIYYYVPSKEALIDEVLELVFEQAGTPDVSGLSWQEAVKVLMHTYLKVAHEHPNLFPVISTHQKTIPASFELSEKLFEVLRTAGFDPKMIIQSAELIVSYVTGYALADIVGSIGIDKDRQHLAEDLNRLPDGWLCNLRELLTDLPEKEARPDFDFGLGILLTGISAFLDTTTVIH